MKIRILASILLCALCHSAFGEFTGERLAYVVGCINCHHQTPKEIINAPPLAIVQAYSLKEFETLLRTGVTSGGRDLAGMQSIMGVVAVEQFNWMTDEEIGLIYEFLRNDWTAERAAEEEAKIPDLYGKIMDQHEGD